VIDFSNFGTACKFGLKMNSQMEAVFGEEVMQKVAKSKILMVGAGGIGCELLKNLVQSGFNNITVIDLDTIDVSNLNRQFLFRRKHVDRSKSEIARESALEFVPGLKIDAYKDNIKNPKYNSQYFKGFDIVLNALDNLSARRHINRLCLVSGTSLIESGTQGYIGQIQPIVPKETECFECQPKETPKTFPVCTLRSYPDKPVHCIVWAKVLFALLFGPPDEGNILKELKSEGPLEGESVFKRVLFEDVATQIRMGKFNGKTEPIPLDLNEIKLSECTMVESENLREHQVLSNRDNLEIFMNTFKKLSEDKDCGNLQFDKDFEVAMRFVSAAANLRMHQFHIPPQSFFANKGVAGNIVHAIATSNAIVAAGMIMAAIKMLNNQNSDLRLGFISTASKRVWFGPKTPAPSAKCAICQKCFIYLSLDFNKWTYGNFVKEILQKEFNFIEPDLLINETTLIEIEDDFDECKDLPLSHERIGCLLGNEISLVVDDFRQECKMNFKLRHIDNWDKVEFPRLFVMEKDGFGDACKFQIKVPCAEVYQMKNGKRSIEEESGPNKKQKLAD